MATAPVMTTMTAGLGNSSALTGDATGLDGLFAALMSGETAPMPVDVGVPVQGVASPVGEGMISVLLGVKAGDAEAVDTAVMNLGGVGAILAPQAEVQTEVQLGDAPALTVSGDEASVKAFVHKLKDVYQKVVVEGGLTVGQLSDSTELAGALTKLGMAPEEAAGVAERIQTMLKLLDQQQEVDEKTAGSLVAMMLAVMGQNGQPLVVDGKAVSPEDVQTLGLQIVSVEQQPANGNAASAGTMTAWRMRMSGDVTRDLLGLDGKVEPKATDTDGEKPRKVEVMVVADGDGSIHMALPDVKTDVQPLPVQAVNIPVTDAQPSAAAQAATAVTSTGAAVKVAADERIEAPKGDTYYKLQADKNGVETLDAVKPMAAAQDTAQNMMQAAPQPQLAQAMAASQAAAQADAAAGASYAQRMADIQAMVDRAQVGKQVAVQIQPLIEQGGGTVRINLNPKELGKITVELTIAEGKVHGAIAASEPAVVEQLARELHSLRHGLADAGLKLGEQGINLMLSNQGGNGQNGQGGQADQQARTGGSQGGMGQQGADGATGGADGLAANLAAWVAPDRLLDVSA